MSEETTPPLPSSRLRTDVAWLWAGYFARTVGYAGLVVVLTRSLGADGFGELSLFLALTLGVSQLAGSWPFLAVPVLSAHGSGIGHAFRSASIVAAGATGVCLLAAIPIAMAILDPSAGLLVSLVLYSAALVALQGVYGVLQALSRMRGIATVQTLERVTGFLAVLAAALLTTLTVSLAAGLLAGAALATCFAAFALWVPAEVRRGSVTEGPRELLPSVVRAVGPMGIVSVCAYGVAWMDVYVLDLFESRAQVGIYALAYQVFTFVVQLGSLWAVATLPRHARSAAAGQEADLQIGQGRLLLVCRLWAGLIAVVGVGAVITLPHLFGADFDDAATPVALLMAGAVSLAGYFAVMPAFVAGGRTRELVWVSLGSVFINLALDIALVPVLGISGPAIATLAQTIFGAVALLYLALGLRRAWSAVLSGLPAAIALAALAADPGSPLLLAGCVVIGGLTGVWGLLAARSAPAPEAKG